MRDMKNDLISRQAAIDELEHKKDKNAKGDISGFYNKIIQNDIDALMQLPSVQSEQTKMIKEIRRWINSGNRGSADYFIVDKIEEIINKYEE